VSLGHLEKLENGRKRSSFRAYSALGGGRNQDGKHLQEAIKHGESITTYYWVKQPLWRPTGNELSGRIYITIV
jgi:hypothetical protein